MYVYFYCGGGGGGGLTVGYTLVFCMVIGRFVEGMPGVGIKQVRRGQRRSNRKEGVRCEYRDSTVWWRRGIEEGYGSL